MRPAPVAAIMLNTRHIADERDARDECARVEQETGRVCDDPVRFGAERLWTAVAAALPRTVSGELALGRYRLPLGRRTLVMGIVNANPDSFYDQGRHAGSERATARARRADRPGSRHHRRRRADGPARGGGRRSRPRSTGSARSSQSSRRSACRSRSTRIAPRSPTPCSPPARCSSTTTPASSTRSCRALLPATAPAWCARTTGARRARTRRAATPSRSTRSRTSCARACEQALEAGVDARSLLVDPCFGFGKDTESDLALLAALPRLRTLGAAAARGLLAQGVHRRRDGARGGRSARNARGRRAVRAGRSRRAAPARCRRDRPGAAARRRGARRRGVA